MFYSIEVRGDNGSREMETSRGEWLRIEHATIERASQVRGWFRRRGTRACRILKNHFPLHWSPFHIPILGLFWLYVGCSYSLLAPFPLSWLVASADPLRRIRCQGFQEHSTFPGSNALYCRNFPLQVIYEYRSVGFTAITVCWSK